MRDDEKKAPDIESHEGEIYRESVNLERTRLVVDTEPSESATGQKVESITYPQALKAIGYNALGPLGLGLIRGSASFANSAILANSSKNQDVRASTTLINSFTIASATLNAPLDYVSTAVGELNTENDRGRIGQMTQAGWLLALCSSVPQIVILISSKAILDASGQNPKLTTLVGDFFNISVIATPLFSLQYVTDQMSLTTGHRALPIISQTLGIGGGLLVAYLLTYGDSALNSSMDGVAWSFTARASITSAVCLCYLLVSNKIEIANRKWGDYAPYNLFKFNKEGFFSAFKLLGQKGLPLIAITASETGVVYLLDIIIGRLGVQQLGAQLIISQYQNLLLIPVYACAAAAQITISNSHSNKKNIMKYGNTSIALSLVVPGMYIILTLSIPRLIMRPFINANDPDYDAIAKLLDNDKLLLIEGFNLAFNAIRIVSQLSLNGAGVSGWLMVANALSVWLGVGFGYLLAHPANLGMVGLSLGVGSGLLLSATAQGLYWRHKAKSLALEQENTNATEYSTLFTSQQSNMPPKDSIQIPSKPPLLFSPSSQNLSPIETTRLISSPTNDARNLPTKKEVPYERKRKSWCCIIA